MIDLKASFLKQKLLKIILITVIYVKIKEMFTNTHL